MAGDPLFHFRIAPAVLSLLGVPTEDRARVVRRAGLPESAETGPCTTTLAKMRAFVEDAASRWTAGDFGLALARAVPPGTYEAAELVVRTAPTLAGGLVSLVRFASLINPIGRFDVEERTDRLSLHYFVVGQRDGLGEAMNTYTIAYIYRALRNVGLPEGGAVAVWLAHPSSRHGAELKAFFGVRVGLGTPTSGLALRADVAAGPLVTSDAVTHGFLERHAAERLVATGLRTTSSMVAEVIEKEIRFGGLDLATVARRLAMTERTAQRRLTEEGTTFRDVLDQVRRRVAERLVGTGIPSSRISDLLGFADSRSFRRARARWGLG